MIKIGLDLIFFFGVSLYVDGLIWLKTQEQKLDDRLAALNSANNISMSG